MIQLTPNLLPSPPSNATAAVAAYMAQAPRWGARGSGRTTSTSPSR
jgi:hypothetical protein